MSLFTTENEEVACKVCPNKIQVNTSDEKLHLLQNLLSFLRGLQKWKQLGKKKYKLTCSMQKLQYNPIPGTL